MKTTLIECADLNGARWRLGLEEPSDPNGAIAVVLECCYRSVVDGWVHVSHVTSNLDHVGVVLRKRGVVMIDTRKARAVLSGQMAQHGATPRPQDIHEGLQMMSMPVEEPIEEPTLKGHKRIGLLEYLLEIETRAAVATRGLWRAALPHDRSLGAVLDAVVTGGVTDPVCESMTHADVHHVLAAQPLAVSAIVRKLREAFFLLQDLSRAAQAARGEIDHLVAPTRLGISDHMAEQYASRIDMFDRWMAHLGQRCAAFPTIQIPDVEGGP